ncbi:LysR family transcriptional regulator [Arthrobacter sp. B0490]|uniref:LysR family transcriptional regulator n=1 Tax=Arthrobacter sp. B0490 TaxID=2058891 RepID=UPI000CE32BE8|nr:LysR family transcriptional regulator [Arthrobacter sp. B0490]
MTADVRHLRMLIAIAELGTITRAAEAQHITQPAASRLLQQLEKHLGVQLVERSTRHLRLTPAGKEFLPRARRAVQLLDDTLDPSTRETGPLRVGYAWSVLGSATPQVLATWQQRNPGKVLELHRIDQRLAGLPNGSVDAAIVRDVGDTEPGLHRALVQREPRLVALHKDHHLANRRSLNLSLLTTETVVINTVSGTTTPTLWANFAHQPQTIDVTNTDDWLMAIASRKGIGVTGIATQDFYSAPDVMFLPLEDAPPITVELLWREPAHPDVDGFISAIRDTLNSTS